MLALRWISATFFIAVATATPIATPTVKEGPSQVQGRALPSGTVTCGSNLYSVSRISSAVAAGGSHVAAGTTVGSNSYPHRFYNYEGLNMWCSSTPSGPWYEFPILSSGSIYTGGSPGADRVVHTTNGTYCATVTHTGASSTNGFVQCLND
ncbi:guanyl-specific ribonuclease T1 precursor [Auriculariales sp. MPI-PUGE-AT-0066]|nr:guanyl-specific ribonuclease T1 precursor [Auriculariales sp. MPI-PUGE-AT-0066]